MHAGAIQVIRTKKNTTWGTSSMLLAKWTTQRWRSWKKWSSQMCLYELNAIHWASYGERRSPRIKDSFPIKSICALEESRTVLSSCPCTGQVTSLSIPRIEGGENENVMIFDTFAHSHAHTQQQHDWVDDTRRISLRRCEVSGLRVLWCVRIYNES